MFLGRLIFTPNKKFKEPNESYYTLDSEIPTVNIEVGASDYIGASRTDASW